MTCSLLNMEIIVIIIEKVWVASNQPRSGKERRGAPLVREQGVGQAVAILVTLGTGWAAFGIASWPGHQSAKRVSNRNSSFTIPTS